MATYGYARVSSTDQNEARQIDALQKAGCDKIFLDKQSGKDFERPQYKKCVRALKEGDILFVQSLDRLGRNYELIKEQWAYIVKKKKAHIVILDMPILDTRQGQGLIGKFISDIVLQLLAFVSQTERENIRKRQAEGIRLAKLRGVKFGHAPRPLPDGFDSVCIAVRDSFMSCTKAAEKIGMCRTTFMYNYRLWEAQHGYEPKQFMQCRQVGVMPDTFMGVFKDFTDKGAKDYDLTEFSKASGISHDSLRRYWCFWKRQAENYLSGENYDV